MGAVVAAHVLPSNADTCASLAAHPAAQRSMHQLHGLLSSAAALVPLPVSMGAAHDGVGECACLLAFLQLGLGLLAPLLVDALQGARLFEAHQRQRAGAGLPPECGLHAEVYTAVWQLTLENYWLSCAIYGWMLYSALWDVLCLAYALPLPDAP